MMFMHVYAAGCRPAASPEHWGRANDANNIANLVVMTASMVLEHEQESHAGMMLMMSQSAANRNLSSELRNRVGSRPVMLGLLMISSRSSSPPG